MIAYAKNPLTRTYGHDDLITKQAKRKIFFNVLTGHIIFILFPMIILSFQFSRPEEKIISVNIASFMPPSQNTTTEQVREQAQEQPAPEQPKEQAQEPVSEPVIAPPVPAEPEIAPIPPPKEPEIQPPKEQKIKPTETAKKPPEKKPETKPETKPVTEPPPPKKFLKPEDILKTGKVVKGTPQKPFTPIKASDLIKDLKNATAKGDGRGPSTSVSGPPGSSSLPTSYYDTVRDYIYRLWLQPLKSELGGRLPKVKVSLSVDGTGKILSTKVLSTSGISAMDKSVDELLISLKSVPAPLDGNPTVLEVILEIVDN